MSLLPQHQKLISESGITDTVAKERGYRSVKTKAELRDLGFGENQRRIPGLLIPTRDVAGEIANYLLRPDEPRIKNGRALKYEIPVGSQMTLDVPRAAHADIDDPRVPLFITEGARKADAAVSIGLCCASLIGVWCWRGTNEKGGKVALPEFESVALNGREAYIVFDSDVMTKRSVHGALERLSAFLRSRDARVRFIYLPAGEKGEKVGLDDFLAGGADRSQLMELASSELRNFKGDEDQSGAYFETEEGIFWRKSAGPDGETVALTNFTARITADILEDDGAEQHRLLEIESGFNGRSGAFQIPASQFESLDWAIEKVGAGAAIAPGYAQRQRARHAIQILSGDPPRHERFGHLGWRQIEGHWVYLSNGAVICADGVIEGVDVALTGALGNFALPAPPTEDELRLAIQASLGIAELAPDEISLPLLGAIYRAPLGPSDFSVFLVGPTGVFKTATAAICQAHWGAGFDERNLPESFRSTVNAIEGLLFQAKDTLVVVDEFAPGGTRSDIERAHRDADRVLRSQGNHAGRARMTRDARLRAPKTPRGLTLVTGEDVPAGQSLRARIFASELTDGSIDISQLARLQEAAREGLLAQAMAGYLRYVAERRDTEGEDLRAKRDQVRQEISGTPGHRRAAGATADLLVGIDTLIDFAVDCRALDPAEAEDFAARARRAIMQAGERQLHHQGGAEPTERFRALINSALSSGVAHLANPQGGEPEEPLGLGWRTSGSGEWQAQGKRIGWESGGHIYLDLGASLAAVQEVARGSTPIAVGEDTLRKRLHERGHLASTELECRSTYAVRRKLEGKRREVLHMTPTFLEAESDQDITDPERSDGSTTPQEPTKQATSAKPPWETLRPTDGRAGQVPTVEESNHADAPSRHTDPPPATGETEGQTHIHPELDHPDHPDPAEQEEAEAEMNRLTEKFPDLGEEGS